MGGERTGGEGIGGDWKGGEGEGREGKGGGKGKGRGGEGKREGDVPQRRFLDPPLAMSKLSAQIHCQLSKYRNHIQNGE